MAHTPGPWKYDDVWALIEGPQGEEVCAVHAATISGKATRVNRHVAEDNARLIAAAPALLEACKQAESVLRTFRESSVLKAGAPNTEEKLRAAIAAATKDG